MKAGFFVERRLYVDSGFFYGTDWVDGSELQMIFLNTYEVLGSVLNAWELCGNKFANEANVIDEKLWLV